MKLTLSAVLASTLLTVSAQASLTCDDLGKKGDVDMGVFEEIENPRIAKKTRASIVRLAVANFYGECGKTWNDDFCYRPEMSDAEVDELGETVGVVEYRHPTLPVYYGVNVGFGGGNSAIYFFDLRSHAMQDVYVYDWHDCAPIKTSWED